jgi:phosphohistidine swiveling domain-containing protein
MINPNRDLFKWGPIDGKPCYVMTFVDSFMHYYRFIGVSWPDVILHYKDDRVIGIIDYEDLRDVGQFLFENHVLNEKVLKKSWKSWENSRDAVLEFEKKVNKGLGFYSDEELEGLWVRWHKTCDLYWLESFLPELSNWGGERLLKRRIESLKGLDKKDFVHILEKLSAPEDLSFYQTEELDLMKIKLLQDKEKRLKEHQKKYYWINNSYGQSEILSVDFFREKLEKITEKDAQDKIKDIEEYVKKVKQEKEKIIKKYGINYETANIAHKLAFCIWWQDFRKKYVFIAIHIITEFLKEISRRKNIAVEDLTYYSLDDKENCEVSRFLQTGKKLDLTERKKGYFIYYHAKGGIENFEGKKAQELVRPYMEVKIDKNMREFSGLVVSQGTNPLVSGKAKIIITPKQMGHMNKGDILVASMTSPDFIVAIRKASAIVTDEGGMTCHAAIVSRELKIPCIVATRIATKLLKDNDLVEVDADHGRVKILKRAR